ncbi:rhodanese-like domain-containing protein [Mycoplasmatota bacterium]|nr:rhodanese-like domain-containing protein [Mycoplasmatota bacterium]
MQKEINDPQKISFPDLIELIVKDKVFVLDVRTRGENQFVNFPFAINIPLGELNQHLDMLPRDKLIATFCVSQRRSAIATTYLNSIGYHSKFIGENLGDLARLFNYGFEKQ